MNNTFNNIISRYLNKNYFNYNFLIHNTWNRDMSRFFEEYLKEQNICKEYLVFNSKDFSNEDTIKIRNFLNITTFFDDDLYKIIIILDIDNLSISYINALLKKIEEPESPVLFFFTANNIFRVINTIRSRCFAINCRSFITENLLIEENYIKDITISELYKILTEKSGVLSSIYQFYNQQLINTSNMKKHQIKNLLNSINALRIDNLIEEFNCNEGFLYLDLFLNMSNKF